MEGRTDCGIARRARYAAGDAHGNVCPIFVPNERTWHGCMCILACICDAPAVDA